MIQGEPTVLGFPFPPSLCRANWGFEAGRREGEEGQAGGELGGEILGYEILGTFPGAVASGQRFPTASRAPGSLVRAGRAAPPESPRPARLLGSWVGADAGPRDACHPSPCTERWELPGALQALAISDLTKLSEGREQTVTLP